MRKEGILETAIDNHVHQRLPDMEEPQILNPGTSIATPKAIFVMADYGHDPTGAHINATVAALGREALTS